MKHFVVFEDRHSDTRLFVQTVAAVVAGNRNKLRKLQIGDSFKHFPDRCRIGPVALGLDLPGLSGTNHLHDPFLLVYLQRLNLPGTQRAELRGCVLHPVPLSQHQIEREGDDEDAENDIRGSVSGGSGHDFLRPRGADFCNPGSVAPFWNRRKIRLFLPTQYSQTNAPAAATRAGSTAILKVLIKVRLRGVVSSIGVKPPPLTRITARSSCSFMTSRMLRRKRELGLLPSGSSILAPRTVEVPITNNLPLPSGRNFSCTAMSAVRIVSPSLSGPAPAA
ncbi:hypothetical protein ES705_24854 [subsurface metagenome]